MRTFIEKITEELAQAGYKTLVREITKTNISYTGLSILFEENCFPTINVEPYFERFKNGEPIKSLADEILSVCEKHQIPSDFDTSSIIDYDNVKDKITVSLVNAKRNKNLLENVVSRRFEDLAVIYKIQLGCINDKPLTITVTKKLVQEWGVTEEELYVTAVHNSNIVMPGMICSFSSLLGSVFDGEGLPMYVCTNQEKNEGAAAMIYSDKIAVLAEEIDSDLYILPSSRHEVICLPYANFSPYALLDMVKSVNSEMVEAQDFLSDSVYLYKRKARTIKKIA